MTKMLNAFTNRIAAWHWKKKTNALKTMHWTTIPIFPKFIELKSADRHEVVQLTEWIESTLPLSIEQLDIQMSARNSFSSLNDLEKTYMMNYIWQRTMPLHNAVIDRYGQKSIIYDFAHSDKPSMRFQ